MPEVHFVFEKPQKHDRPEKKRSRLVTSCDACRSRKIKCRPSGFGDDVCEACQVSGAVCVYEERDRIRAERGIASFTVAPAPPASTAKSLALSRSARASSKIASRNTSRGPSASGSKLHSLPSLRNHPTDPQSVRSLTASPLGQRKSSLATLQSCLFDPLRHNYPNPHLLSHFVTLFFDYTGDRFLFLDREHVIKAVATGALSPILANSIAAYAARFSDRIQHATGSRQYTGEPFLEVAKSLLATSMETASLELVHVALLIAWIESGATRPTVFFDYSRIATFMTLKLNLHSEEAIMLAETERERNIRRQTFWSVAWMDLISASASGKPTSFVLETCNTSVPFAHLSNTRVMLYRALKPLFIVMSVLRDVANGAPPRNSSPTRDHGLRQMRRFLVAFRASLPEALLLGVDHMRQAQKNNELHDFVLLHLLIHTLSVVVNCPALFWTSQNNDSLIDCPQVDVAWASARSIVDAVVMLAEIDPYQIIGTAGFFLPLSIARAAFSLEKAYTVVSWPSYGGESNTGYTVLSDHQEYLDRCQSLVSKMAYFWARINEVKIAAQPVALIESSEHAAHVYEAAHAVQSSLHAPVLPESIDISPMVAGAYIAEQSPQPPDYSFVQTPSPGRELWLSNPFYDPVGVPRFPPSGGCHAVWDEVSVDTDANQSLGLSSTRTPWSRTRLLPIASAPHTEHPSYPP